MAQKYRALILEVTIIDHGPYGWEWQVSDRGDVIMTGFEDTREQAKYAGNSSLFRLLAAGWYPLDLIPNALGTRTSSPNPLWIRGWGRTLTALLRARRAG